MFANPRPFAITMIVLFYAMALFGVFCWSLQAPLGDFWHFDGTAALVICFAAVAMNILIYFDESFGLHTRK